MAFTPMSYSLAFYSEMAVLRAFVRVATVVLAVFVSTTGYKAAIQQSVGLE